MESSPGVDGSPGMDGSLGLAQARQIADEALADASRRQLRISVAVADEAGALLAFARVRAVQSITG